MNEDISTSPVALPDSLRGFLQAWEQAFSEVLTQISGTQVAIEAAKPGDDGFPAGETDVHLLVTAAGNLRGEMSLRLASASALRLAQVFMGEAGTAQSEFRPDHQEAIEELFRQVAGHVTTGLKARWGEIQLRVQSSTAPSWPAAFRGNWSTGTQNPPELTLEWQISAALNAALAPTSTQAQTPQSSAVDPAPQGKSVVQDNLDLLMDVELEVVLRFGERFMPLREVLELAPGSVVELERNVGEPADLLLDGRVVARGEVVVVDGNFGLRVSEIVPRNTAA